MRGVMFFLVILHSGRTHGRIRFPIKFVHFTYAFVIPLIYRREMIFPTLRVFCALSGKQVSGGRWWRKKTS
ncbi:hypothetical protein CW714_04240 [Methanophagales archaeon]|nr:MAG: hypothetical protein CW714_04240 [Methanophagales archaeon]